MRTSDKPKCIQTSITVEIKNAGHPNSGIIAESVEEGLCPIEVYPLALSGYAEEIRPYITEACKKAEVLFFQS